MVLESGGLRHLAPKVHLALGTEGGLMLLDTRELTALGGKAPGRRVLCLSLF